MVCELIMSKYPRPITRLSSHGAPYIQYVDDDMSIVFHDINGIKNFLKENILDIEKNYFTLRLQISREDIGSEIVIVYTNSIGWYNQAIEKIFEEEEAKKFIFELKLNGSRIFNQ